MLDSATHSHSSREAKTSSGQPIFAALDLGTNNCRLLVATHESPGATLRVLDSFSRIVRLGEGISATGEISKDAMDRTVAALQVCKRKLQKYSLAESRFVATEACRRAKNSDVFLKRVQQEVGLDIDIISSEEEARLAFLGCASLLAQSANRAIVFDIGGGSTELMWIDVEHAKSKDAHKHDAENKSITDWLSINTGVMNLADRFGGQAFSDLAYGDMVQYILQRLESFNETNQISDTIGTSSVQMLSTSGTVTTLAAIHLELPRYDRTRIDGIKLKVSDIRNTIKRLLNMRPSERFLHPCIGADRADFIISGCAIFEAISTMWPTGEITIADRGVREGIILSLMQQYE